LENRSRKERPFFLWVHYLDPHGPLVPPAEYIPLNDPYRDDALAILEDNPGDMSSYSIDLKEGVRTLYAAEVRYVDEAVGEIWSTLEETGLKDNTILIVTSDHGEELYERGKYNHGHTMYPELTRIPLVVYSPEPLAPDRVEKPVSLIDLAPTILDGAGIPIPETMEGESLLSPGDPSRIIYMQGTIDRPVEDIALFDPPYYYIYRAPETENELYDVNSLWVNGKPASPINEGNPDVVSRFEEESEKHIEYLEEKTGEFTAGSDIRIEKGTRERLKKLGYLQ
jgi:arylsulfatase